MTEWEDVVESNVTYSVVCPSCGLKHNRYAKPRKPVCCSCAGVFDYSKVLIYEKVAK